MELFDSTEVLRYITEFNYSTFQSSRYIIKFLCIQHPSGGKNEINVFGRGGTEFDPVLDYYNANLKKYTSLVYFTDGECYTSVKPKGKVLWVLSERSGMNEDLPGQVIKLEL